jgi:hypothetical protein
MVYGQGASVLKGPSNIIVTYRISFLTMNVCPPVVDHSGNPDFPGVNSACIVQAFARNDAGQYGPGFQTLSILGLVDPPGIQSGEAYISPGATGLRMCIVVRQVSGGAPVPGVPVSMKALPVITGSGFHSHSATPPNVRENIKLLPPTSGSTGADGNFCSPLVSTTPDPGSVSTSTAAPRYAGTYQVLLLCPSCANTSAILTIHNETAAVLHLIPPTAPSMSGYRLYTADEHFGADSMLRAGAIEGLQDIGSQYRANMKPMLAENLPPELASLVMVPPFMVVRAALPHGGTVDTTWPGMGGLFSNALYPLGDTNESGYSFDIFNPQVTLNDLEYTALTTAIETTPGCTWRFTQGLGGQSVFPVGGLEVLNVPAMIHVTCIR